MMKKRPKPSDGERAELVVPKKRKSARLLASRDNDKQTEKEDAANAETNTSKNAGETSKDAGSSSSDSSPNNNCSICLGQLENKSFTDSCFHTFCFVCLLEWSKVKAVCPLCKQPFKSIIHNVRSIEDYDQYYLKADELTSDDSRRFRYRTTMIPGTRHRRDAQEQHHRMLLQRPSRAMMRGPFGRTGQAATSEFRQRIYATGMRVKELVPTDGRPPRYRDISAAFFARNPASTHRLVPWLNRELNVLLNHHDDHIRFVLELILDLIKRYDIRSEDFYEHIQPFTGRRTEHFIHEFYSFARAPYDIVAYDQNATYDNVDLPVHEIESDDDTTNAVDDDSDVIMVSPPPGTTPSTNVSLMSLTPLLDRVRNFLGTFSQHTDTAYTGWDTPIPGTSHSWSPPYTTTYPDDPIDITDSTTHQNASGSPVSSTASDIVIVAVEKPWDCRTPICLSSDSDCGVTVPVQYRDKHHHRDAHRKRRSGSSSRSKDIRSHHRHHRRHRESSRRSSRSRDRRERRHDRDRSISSRHRHRDGRKERYHDIGHGRSHHLSVRHGERKSTERHSRSRSHIYVDSDSSHSSHRHKRRHKDRRERKHHNNDEVTVTRVHPTYKRTVDGDVSNETHYKKHPTGHKHSKSTDNGATDNKPRATVKEEKDATVVLRSVVVQSSGVGERPFIPVAIREEPQNDGYADHQEPHMSDAKNTASSAETAAVDQHQRSGMSDVNNAVRKEDDKAVTKNQVPDAQPSTSELSLHKECPRTKETAEAEPTKEPVVGNDPANVASFVDDRNVESSHREHKSQDVPLTETTNNGLLPVDVPSATILREMANDDDRVEVMSEESSSVDVESIEPTTSGFYQQLGSGAQCVSVSDDDDVQFVETGSSNDVNEVEHAYTGRQINVTSSTSSLSDSNSSDSCSGKGHLSIVITSPEKESCSEGGSAEQYISITDDDEDNGQRAPTKMSSIEGSSGNVCQPIVSVSDDNNARRNFQAETTDSMNGDFNVVSDDETMHQLQQLKAALAANNNMDVGGTSSIGLVEQLKQLLPKCRNKMVMSEQTAEVIQQRSLCDGEEQPMHASATGDDNKVEMAKMTASVQSSDMPSQRKLSETGFTLGMIRETNQSQEHCQSASELDNKVDATNDFAGRKEDVRSGVSTGDDEGKNIWTDKRHRTNIYGGSVLEIGDHIKEPMSRANDSLLLNKSGVVNRPADTNSNPERQRDSDVASEITENNSGQDSSTLSSIHKADEILQQDVQADDDDDDNDEFAEQYLENMLEMN